MVKTFTPEKNLKLAVFLLVSTFVLIIYGFYHLKGTVENVRAGKIKIAEVQRDLDLITRARIDRDQYTSDILRIRSTLPTRYSEVAFFTSQMERLAENNAVSILTTIDKDQTQERQPFNSIVYSIEAQGNYPNTAEFLTQMSRLPYHTVVDSLRIESDDGGLTTNIRFRLFVEKNEK